MIVLGVIADTHVPDRAAGLKPGVLPIFRQAGVQAILHAGDVCIPAVLAELETVAPVYAVRGNRDWVYLKDLPFQRRLTFGGVKIGLAHGHGNLSSYVKDKLHHLVYGLDEERYFKRMLATFPNMDVIVFGHMHVSVNLRRGHQLLFDPGSACIPEEENSAPSVGLLRIHDGGEVQGEILYLTE
jgi:putative phosphoesterase